MNPTIRGKIYRTLLASLFVLLLSIHLPTGSYGVEIPIDIDLAPNIINLNGSMETFVIHTNIAYGIVDPSTVTLTVNPPTAALNGDDNDIYIYGWKMDSLGLFDAIILLSDIEEFLVVGQKNKFRLAGETIKGEKFSGEDEILVIDKASKLGKLQSK